MPFSRRRRQQTYGMNGKGEIELPKLQTGAKGTIPGHQEFKSVVEDRSRTQGIQDWVRTVSVTTSRFEVSTSSEFRGLNKSFQVRISAIQSRWSY